MIPRDRVVPWRSKLQRGFTTKPLKYIVLFNPEVLSESTKPDVPINYVDISSVDSNGVIESTEEILFADAPSRARRVTRVGDVIVSTVRTYLTAISLISKEDLIVSTGFAVLRPGPEVDSRFLGYWMRSQYMVNEIVARSTGVSYPAINPSELGQLPFPVITGDVQHAIADFLDHEVARLDRLIEKKKRFKELIEQIRRGIIAAAVTRGIRNTPLKPSGVEWFGDVPDHWRVNQLGRLSETINDINHEMPDAVAEGIPLLSAKDLKDDGSLNFTEDVKLISRDDFVRLGRKITPKRGDIVYSRYGACLGKARLVELDREFLVSYSCVIIRLDKRIADPRYFTHLLDSDLVLVDANLRTQGIAVPDLGNKMIAKFRVPVPPIEEQREIAKWLDHRVEKLRSAATAIGQGIDRLQEFRAALISDAVTGQIDIRKYRPQEDVAVCQ
jgi:type I restriction enzyme, S subunit